MYINENITKLLIQKIKSALYVICDKKFKIRKNQNWSQQIEEING
jgi:hypothetical protein